MDVLYATQETTMKVELNPKEMQTNKADSRGRITLGAEYAGKEVTVIITDTDD